MDRHYIEDHLLIDRYVLGSLSENEEAMFEERLMWDHALMDEVRLAERLRDGLRMSVGDNAYVLPVESRSIWSRLSDVFAVPQYAATASFALAVALTAGVLLNPFAPVSDNHEFSPPQVEITPIFAVRGSTPPPVAIRRDATNILLVDAWDGFDLYRVTIRKDGSSGATVWQEDRLRATFQQSIGVKVSADDLTEGVYVLTLEGEDSADTGSTRLVHLQDIAFTATFY